MIVRAGIPQKKEITLPFPLFLFHTLTCSRRHTCFIRSASQRFILFNWYIMAIWNSFKSLAPQACLGMRFALQMEKNKAIVSFASRPPPRRTAS